MREQCYRKGYVQSEEEAVEMALDEGARRGFTSSTLQSHRERLEKYLEAVKLVDERGEEEEEEEEEEGEKGRGDAYRMLPAMLRSNNDATGYTDVVEDYYRAQLAAQEAAQVPAPIPTASQDVAIDFVLEKDSRREQYLMVMTGDGGCGKSWTTTAVVSKLIDRGREVVMAGMTGVACDIHGKHVITFDAIMSSSP